MKAWNWSSKGFCPPIGINSSSLCGLITLSSSFSITYLALSAGRFFCFKLRLRVDAFGNICDFHISKSNYHDRRAVLQVIGMSHTTEVIVGDQHYGGQPPISELSALGIRAVSNAQPGLSQEDTALPRQRPFFQCLKTNTSSSVAILKVKLATINLLNQSLCIYNQRCDVEIVWKDLHPFDFLYPLCQPHSPLRSEPKSNSDIALKTRKLAN